MKNFKEHKREEFYLRYSGTVYSIGIGPFMESLKKQGVTNKNMILDVGCGPGQWTIAAAMLNKEGKVYGIDPQDGFLDIAKSRSKAQGLQNCSFEKLSYDELLDRFEPNSFDVIMCNNVLQYIDYEKAVAIFSKLLRGNGVLLLFWNQCIGYFLEKYINSLIRLNPKQFARLSFMFTWGSVQEFILHRREQHYPASFSRLQRICGYHDIELKRIENNPKLHYKRTFFCFDNMFSCRGVKNK